MSLTKKAGFAVNVKRVARLMVEMGLQAIYPKPNTSKTHRAPRSNAKRDDDLLRKLIFLS